MAGRDPGAPVIKPAAHLTFSRSVDTLVCVQRAARGGGAAAHQPGAVCAGGHQATYGRAAVRPSRHRLGGVQRWGLRGEIATLWPRSFAWKEQGERACPVHTPGLLELLALVSTPRLPAPTSLQARRCWPRPLPPTSRPTSSRQGWATVGDSAPLACGRSWCGRAACADPCSCVCLVRIGKHAWVLGQSLSLHPTGLASCAPGAAQVVASGVVDKYIGESARVIREMFR